MKNPLAVPVEKTESEKDEEEMEKKQKKKNKNNKNSGPKVDSWEPRTVVGKWA